MSFALGYFLYSAAMFMAGYLHRGEIDKLRSRALKNVTDGR